MAAGDRFKSWVEGLSTSWKDKLSGWAVNLLAAGAKRGLKAAAPTSGVIADLLDKYKVRTGTSDDLTNLLDWIRSQENTPAGWFIGLCITGVQMLGVILGGSEAVANEIKYAQYRAVRSQILDPISALTAWRRRSLGQTNPLDDLRSAGFSESRIETMKAITEIIPNAADIVRFALREVYSPEIAEQYGQFQDIPTGAYPDAEKAGLSEDMFKKYWAAHWGLPSASDGFELLHRGILKEKELRDLLKANDIMPYWRDQLIKLSWNIPTRVDVRRFWDLRTIDEPRLREIYTGLGYHGQDLEDYVLWTKIFVDFPDLLARYKNGWIKLDQVRSELIAMGMKPERADKLIEEKIKKAAPERVAAEKDITKTDIFAGVKKGVITRVEGGELLVDIGYSNDEAVYLLDVNIPTDEETSVKTARELTKGDILAGLKTGAITLRDARSMLLKLRYKAPDVEFILKVYQATALELEKSDIITAFKQGALTKEAAMSRLTKLGYSSEDATILLTVPQKTAAEVKKLEATRADIVTAVKKGLITQEAGYMMLLDLNFAPDAAIFILSVATEESPFSPMTFDEFKDRTQKWRLAAGMEGKPMTEEIKRLGAEVVRLSAEVSALEKSIKAEQAQLVPGNILPAEATVRVKELQAILYKAQTELIRIKTDYNAKVAEWRHASK
jgi:hypothetical protein